MFGTTWEEIVSIWVSGGICMIPLALVCLFIYTNVTRLWLDFANIGHAKVPEATWLGWIENPAEGKGQIGELIRFSQANVHNIDEVGRRFAEIQMLRVPDFDRRIVLLGILVNVSPLLGLLGTVIGMLATFKVISTGGGNTIDLVADGIRVALITTQAGLTIAIPGFFMANAIKRKRNNYVGFLIRLESMTMQHFKKRLG
ncbi:MAG TPA: MotA/TolQ/ExbB proton channel family protein [Opitutaceae bacterium]|nr:MotA/TolQ/ExbB proton channel family protein [Opitutaceae bacterium]